MEIVLLIILNKPSCPKIFHGLDRHVSNLRESLETSLSLQLKILFEKEKGIYVWYFGICILAKRKSFCKHLVEWEGTKIWRKIEYLNSRMTICPIPSLPVCLYMPTCYQYGGFKLAIPPSALSPPPSSLLRSPLSSNWMLRWTCTNQST